MKNLTILVFLFLSSIEVFAQNEKIYSYESNELTSKPTPIKEFTDWLADNNEKIGKAAPANSKKTTKVTLVFVVDKEGKIVNPKIWRGIGQGYDVYAYQLLDKNPFRWEPGKINSSVPVNTEVYYQLDFIKNNNKIMTKENEPLN